MAQNKTQTTDTDVASFLATVEDEARRADCESLCSMMHKVTGCPPAMWGGSIVGFGNYCYRYESGRQGTTMITGFSPRKSDLSIYLMAGSAEQSELLARLGRHKMGKSCLSIRRLADVDLAVLEQLIAASVKEVRRTHTTGDLTDGHAS